MANDFQGVIVEQSQQTPAAEQTLGRVGLLAFALVLFGLVPLRGIPGLLIFSFFAHTLISFLPGSHTWCRLSPEALLPLTLCITFLWPISLPMGYTIAFRRLRSYPKSGQVLIWLGIMVLWGALLSIGLCFAGARTSVGRTWVEQSLTCL